MDTLFIVLFLFFPVLTFVLLQLSGFSLLRVGLPQFVVTALFVFSILGTLPLYFGWDEYYIKLGVTDKPLIFRMMLFSGYTMVFVTAGAIFGKKFFNKPAVVNQFEIIRINRSEVWLMIIQFIAVLVVLSIYLSKISSVALFVALFENVSEAKVARSMMGNGFPGKYHWYSLVIHNLANILTFSFFSIYLLARKKVYLFAFVLTFLVSAFTALMATEKAPFAWLLIGLFLVYVLITSNGRYPFKKLTVFFPIVLTFMILSYVVFMGFSELGQVFSSLFSRIFAGSIAPAYHYLEFFPQHQEFLFGASFPNPAGILPHQPFELTKEINNWLSPTMIESGIVGSMPTVFWGEAYANFSLAGVLIVPFIIGFLLYFIEVIISRFIDTPFKIGFYVWVLLHYKDLSVTGFSGYFIDFNLIVLALIFILITFIANNFKIKVKA